MASVKIGCPAATIDIAEAVLAVVRKLATEAKVSGIFHFAGTGAVSRSGFAAVIVQREDSGQSPVGSGRLQKNRLRPRAARQLP